MVLPARNYLVQLRCLLDREFVCGTCQDQLFRGYQVDAVRLISRHILSIRVNRLDCCLIRYEFVVRCANRHVVSSFF